MSKMQHVDGIDKGPILLYALSTCVWCKMTKELLKKVGVAFDYIDVDQEDEREKEKVMAEVARWNPKGSFPTLVFGGAKAVLGFDEKKIREALNR